MIDSRGPPKYSKAGKKPEPVELRIVTEGLVVDGVVTELHSMKQSDGYKQTTASLAVASNRQYSSADVWQRAGCLVQSNPRVLLADVLDHPDWIKRAERGELNGVPCVHVDCHCADGNQVEAWLSIRDGFMVQRLRVGRQGFDNTYIEYENDSFQDHGNGVYFPRHSFMRIYKKGDEPGKPTGSHENFFDEVSINGPIAPERFVLTIPPGTRTMDWRDNTTFVMGKGKAPSGDYPVDQIRTLGWRKVVVKAPARPQPPGPAPPDPAVDVATDIDLGFQQQGVVLEAVFLVRNFGQQPLVLEKFSATCGREVLCRSESGTLIDATRQVIAPAASLALTTRFFALGNERGRYQHQVTFDTNDTRRPRVEVCFTGQVEVGVYCLPRQLDLGRLTPGQVVQHSVRVVDRRRPDQRGELRATTSSSVIELDKMTRASGTADRSGVSGDQPVWLLPLTVRAPETSCRVQETVTLLDRNGKLVGLIPIGAALPSAPTLNPAEVLLVTTGPGSRSTGSRRCIYTSTSGRYSLTIQQAPPELSVRLSKADWAGTYFIDIAEAREKAPGDSTYKITLNAKFDDGRSEAVRIPVTIMALR
jgi:hypothetical protein